MDDLSFYNIIEIEKSRGSGPASNAKRDVKQSRFWLKVEIDELRTELRKALKAVQGAD
jgi:hypothetical protein